MKDMVPKATGNSRLLRSSIPADTTHDELVSMLRAGTFPFDFAGLNAAGISQQGTPLNKSTLLSDETVQKLGIPGSAADATVNDAFMQLSGGMTRLGDVVISMQKEPLPGWYKCDGSLCEDEALMELFNIPTNIVTAVTELPFNQIPWCVPFECNSKYFIAREAMGTLWYSNNLAGPYVATGWSGAPWLKFENNLYYRLQFSVGSYGSGNFYIYTQPTLGTSAGQQQVFTSNNAISANIGVVRFKGSDYVFDYGYGNNAVYVREIFITPAPSLVQRNRFGTRTYNMAAKSENDALLVLATTLGATDTYFNYTDDLITWHEIVVNFDVNGFSLNQYSFQYSSVLHKWICSALRSAGYGGDNNNTVATHAALRIFLHNDITQLTATHIDVDLEARSSCVFLWASDVGEEFICRIMAYESIQDPIYRMYDIVSTDGEKWHIRYVGFSSGSSRSSSNNNLPKFAMYGDTGVTISTIQKTSGGNIYDYGVLNLLDIRKRLPAIDNGFIKGGS